MDGVKTQRTSKTDGMGDSWDTTKTVVEGKVVGFGEKTFDFPSTSIFRKKKEPVVGTIIVLQVPGRKNRVRVEFPDTLPRESLRGQRIKHVYHNEYYSETTCDLETNTYTIVVLTGPAKGEKFQRKMSG